MKVAVIGAGSMGGRHARVLAGMPDVDEVLVVDAVASRATEVAAEVGGRHLEFGAAIDDADAAVIATPAELHAVAVQAAVARRIPVLCEKPLTNDLASSADLVRLVEEAGAHVEVGFHRRHDPAYAAGRARVADGSIGRVHLLRLTAFDPLVAPRPMSDWPPSDGAPLFVHSSIHDFDFVRWLSGQEVVELSADGTRRDESRPTDPRALETAVVSMRLSGGTLAVLEATWLHPAGYDSRAELVGEHAHLSMGWSRQTPASRLEPDANEEAEPWSGYLDRFEAAYRSELTAFLASCRGTRHHSAATARDGLEAMRIAVAATRAVEERRTVSLDEVPGLPRREAA